MDFDPKHDQALDLPLRFPDDPIDEPPTPSQQSQQQQPPSSTSMRRQKSQDPQQQQQQSQKSPVPGPGSGPATATRPAPPPQPTFTVYIRVPAPRNGFVDPPDVDWNKEKDDALWRILSRASKDDIDWEDLARSFNATVGFLLIQATILTERHVSQVRAQTRKVATLGAANANANANANTNTTATAGRDSPMNSPALTSEAMGRTLSSGGGTGGGPAGVRTASAETMRRTASAGSRPPYRGGTSPSVGGGSRSGSRRPSMEDSQVRPTRPPVRPSLETISSFSPDKPIATTTPPVGGRGHPSFSPATAQQQQQARLQSPLPIRPARPTDTVSRANAFDSEGDEDEGEYGGEDEGGFQPESPAATSDSDSSSSSSSTPSEPVMSRIFRRPPGHAPQQQQQKQQQQRQPSSRVPLSARQRGNNSMAQAADGDFGVIGLGISSGGSDEGDADADGDGEESETQAAFLRFKSNTTKAQGSAAAASRQHARHHHHHHHNHQKRRSTADSSSSPSSSASASPTTKAFKTPTVAAATAAAAGAGTASSSASAAAAARLQSSRKPRPGLSAGGGGDIRSPPRLQKMSSSAATRSPAVRAATRGGGAGVPGISREGSEIGTTPSIGSSFSDLDDVSFTQSVLDEALGSKVEDTVVTPNPNSNNSGDPMSSSATRRR